MKETARSSDRGAHDIGVDSGDDRPQEKRFFTEPRLTFVEPKLVKAGKLEELTGFFVVFSP